MVAEVLAVDEIAEKVVNQWVADGLFAFVGHQIFLGGVGDALGFVDQDMIPGLVAIGLSLVGFVPILIGGAVGIEIHHDAAITVTFVAHQLAGLEVGMNLEGLVCGQNGVGSYHTLL